MELSFLQFAVGFVVNYKHSATIPSGKSSVQGYDERGGFSPAIWVVRQWLSVSISESVLRH
jgi:hypothetical protein